MITVFDVSMQRGHTLSEWPGEEAASAIVCCSRGEMGLEMELIQERCGSWRITTNFTMYLLIYQEFW